MSQSIDVYPYSEPQVLTDEIFKMFGGSIDNTSKQQRASVFVMAEYAVYNDLDTFLHITTVTGTYQYHNPLMLDHSYVQSVRLVRFLDIDDRVYYTATGTDLRLNSQEYGKLELDPIGYCHPCGSYTIPYRMQVVYDAGIGSGSCYNPNILMALSTYSQILLNEVIGFGNEAPGDAGVADYSNQEYSETRKGLINTSFGQSPKANFVHRLLARFRKRRHVGL